MSLSLANKYRSQTFTDLVGQDHISRILQYQAMHPSRQTNYLLYGPRGTGKTSTARIYAKALNCENLQDGNPCNVCTSCLLIQNNATVDFIEIDAASHTGVDNVREEILSKVGYTPNVLRKKVYIIDEVHMLSKGAFNALLKTMEEPKPYLCFILATTEFNKVPETIVSRCHVFNFKKIPDDLMIARLSYIAAQENIQTEMAGLQMIAQLADGCQRDANKYLDQVSVLGEVTADNVAQYLGVVGDSTLASVCDAVMRYQTSHDSADAASVITLLESLRDKSIDLMALPRQLLVYCDRQFATSPAGYARLTTWIMAIQSNLRWYPNPLLGYKVGLYI